MEKKKLVVLLSCIAGAVVILGVVIALLLTPITSFLNGGTGEDFHNVGSCGGKTVGPDANATDAGFITPVPENTPLPGETPSAAVTENPTDAPTPTPTIDPYVELCEKADTSMMKDIVNVLLVGVDYSTERETWNGKKEWHSDVMMVLAVNFEENRADLISLPRDTYANIPDVKGIYKLNASLNCGGGLYNDDGSFNPKGLEKVCDAAEWMLGGIEINYYYAVTMTSLKELVDLCGGLEYDMDIAFKIQGRSYEKGLQHVDGQGFLDYCRVRKGVNGLPANEQGDANRVNRQKRMLVAMFRQMQADKLITQIPDILETFDGDLFTNCKYAQTAALAAFAYNLNAENIGMYSMSGSTQSLFQWNFLFTDQNNRVDVIKNVYGISAKKRTQYTLNYGRYRWCDMLYDHYQDLLKPLTKYVQELIDEDDKLPEFTSEPTPEETPTEKPTDTPTAKPTDKPTNTPTVKPTNTPTVKPTKAPTAEPTKEPTAEPTKAPTAEPTKEPTAEPTKEPTAEPTKEPTAEPTKEPTAEPTQGSDDESGEGTEGAAGAVRASRAILYAKATPEQTRKYTKEQRELFESYKTCLRELEELHDAADKEAKKARNGSSNSLNTVGQSYLKKLDEAQALAIEVAKSFNYTKVKNFTTPFGVTSTGWGSSPWAVNYGLNRKFNEIRVDFN